MSFNLKIKKIFANNLTTITLFCKKKRFLLLKFPILGRF